MKIVSLLAGVIFAFTSSSALAGVLYEFTLFQPTDTVIKALGHIELTDAAAASGHVDYTFPTACPDAASCSNTDPNSPILNFNFLAIGGNYTPAAINLDPVTGTGGGWPFRDIGFFARFDIVDGVLTNMYLFASNQESSVYFSGGTQFQFGSDNGDCFTQCFANGQFAIATQSVPEPPSSWLFGITSLSVLVLSRQRTRDGERRS